MSSESGSDRMMVDDILSDVSDIMVDGAEGAESDGGIDVPDQFVGGGVQAEEAVDMQHQHLLNLVPQEFLASQDCVCWCGMHVYFGIMSVSNLAFMIVSGQKRQRW